MFIDIRTEHKLKLRQSSWFCIIGGSDRPIIYLRYITCELRIYKLIIAREFLGREFSLLILNNNFLYAVSWPSLYLSAWLVFEIYTLPQFKFRSPSSNPWPDEPLNLFTLNCVPCRYPTLLTVRSKCAFCNVQNVNTSRSILTVFCVRFHRYVYWISRTQY